MKQARFEIHKGHGDAKDKWFWELMDGQGVVREHSRCHDSKDDARRSIMVLKQLAPNALVIERDKE